MDDTFVMWGNLKICTRKKRRKKIKVISVAEVTFEIRMADTPCIWMKAFYHLTIWYIDIYSYIIYNIHAICNAISLYHFLRNIPLQSSLYLPINIQTSKGVLCILLLNITYNSTLYLFMRDHKFHFIIKTCGWGKHAFSYLSQ